MTEPRDTARHSEPAQRAKNLLLSVSIAVALKFRHMKTAYVYIMASRSRTLYTGVTTNLERRVAEHKSHLIPGFTSRYRIERLVYFEIWGASRTPFSERRRLKGGGGQERLP